MFIFEYGLLKLHLLREKISILIEERLHMRGDRFFFSMLSHLVWWGWSSSTDTALYGFVCCESL